MIFLIYHWLFVWPFRLSVSLLVPMIGVSIIPTERRVQQCTSAGTQPLKSLHLLQEHYHCWRQSTDWCPGYRFHSLWCEWKPWSCSCTCPFQQNESLKTILRGETFHKNSFWGNRQILKLVVTGFSFFIFHKNAPLYFGFLIVSTSQCLLN